MAEEKLLNDEFEKFETMTNVELRGELKRRGYSTSGNKKDLLAKLHSAVEKEQKQPLLEMNLTAANVMNFEHEDEKEQPKSTSINDETKIEENSSINERNSMSVEQQNEFSSTNNKENIQKRELNDEDKSTIIYKKLKRNDFSSQPTSSSSATFLKGFSRSNNTRVNLSLNLLQTLIPDVKLCSMTNEDLDRHLNETFDHYQTTLNNSFSTETMTIGDLVDQTEQRTRTVVLDRIATTDEPIRIKDVTRFNGKSTRFLHITGLTRPFTIYQLRELLQRYGSMTEDQIWLDKVKSQCLVMYKTIDEAEEARQSLDGCRWPTTNPKSMSIRFVRQDEFDFCKSKDLPPDQMTLDSVDRSSLNERDETSDQPVSGFLINEDENPSEPTKTLDDFFRKTEAKPCVYWLPLTEEEVIERDNRKVERQKQRCDRPTTFKDKANSDRHRRRRHSSSSSREKHKQDSPLAKRDAKRY